MLYEVITWLYIDSKNIITQTLNNQEFQCVAIKLNHQLQGFILIEKKDLRLCPSQIITLQIIAQAIASLIDRKKIYNELQLSNEQVLQINTTLTEKERFLEAILESAPVGILLIKDRIVKFANT